MGAARRKDIVPLSEQEAVISFQVAGHEYRLRGWSHAKWSRLPESLRPPDAQPFGDLGWVEIVHDRPG